MSIWWCNQKRDWQQERQAGVVCAKQLTNNTYRTTVGDARSLDIIVHYRRPYIAAFSRARQDGSYNDHLRLVNGHDYGSGWRFETDYWDLQNPIHRNHFRQALIRPNPPKYYPITLNGDVMQGYFFPFDEAGLRVVLNHIDEPLPPWLQPFIP